MPEKMCFGSKEYDVDWPSNPTHALVFAIESLGAMPGASLDSDRKQDLSLKTARIQD